MIREGWAEVELPSSYYRLSFIQSVFESLASIFLSFNFDVSFLKRSWRWLSLLHPFIPNAIKPQNRTAQCGCSCEPSTGIVVHSEGQAAKIYSHPMKNAFYIFWHCSALQLTLLDGRKPLLRNSHITPNGFLDLGSQMPFRSHITELFCTQISLRLGISHPQYSSIWSGLPAKWCSLQCPRWQRLRFMLCYTSGCMMSLWCIPELVNKYLSWQPPEREGKASRLESHNKEILLSFPLFELRSLCSHLVETGMWILSNAFLGNT